MRPDTRSELQALASSPRAAAVAGAMGPDRRLGLVVGDVEVTVRTTATGVEVVPGVADAGVVVALDPDGFAALAAEEHSVFGLLYAGRLKVVGGDVARFGAWEPALQALLYDRPLYDAEAAAPFAHAELARAFPVGHDREEMARFLDEHGYLHVRGVFAPEEVAALAAEVERLRALATPTDGRSWWATGADGSDVCCRLTFMGERSAAVAALADDPRLAALAGLGATPGVELRPAPDRNDGISVVIKHPGVTAGLSDLPWHRDCGLGGHRLLCPGLNLGIQLDRADADNGQLWFLPGSHRHAGPVGDPDQQGLRVVAIDAEPGDVTVHHGHVLHAAPPPRGAAAGRRAVYLGWSRAELFDVIPPGRAYNDVVFADGDGHVRNVAEQAAV